MGRCGQGCDKRKSLTDPSAGQGGSCIRRWLGSCLFRRVPPSLSMNRNSPQKACGSGINPECQAPDGSRTLQRRSSFSHSQPLESILWWDEGDSALADGGSHGFLIPIDRSRIDKPITCCRQSLREGLFSQGPAPERRRNLPAAFRFHYAISWSAWVFLLRCREGGKLPCYLRVCFEQPCEVFYSARSKAIEKSPCMAASFSMPEVMRPKRTSPLDRRNSR